MAATFDLLPRLADLLSYPDAALPKRAADAADATRAIGALWQDLLEAFALETNLLPAAELEELYTRQFDLNPSTSMEIGWHLFGETYKRGSFLANLRANLHAHGVEEGSDLPDHLPTVLRLMAKLDPADARDLAKDCVLPALAKLRPSLAGGAGPYAHLIEAADLLLQDLVAMGGPAKGACGCHGAETACTGTEVNHA